MQRDSLPRRISCHALFCQFFAILKCRSKQTRDAHSQTPTEDGAPDSGQHHLGTSWERISRQGHERHRAGNVSKSSRSRANCVSSIGIPVHLAGNYLLTRIFYCPHVVADLGGLQLCAACHISVLPLHLRPQLPSSRGDDFPIALAWCHSNLSRRFPRRSDLTQHNWSAEPCMKWSSFS